MTSHRTPGDFPQNPNERREWIWILQSFQDSKTGIFFSESHSDYHTTAHCTAALELFDARPTYPFRFMNHLEEREGLEKFLEELDWHENPWSSSHDGAGCCSAFAIAGGVSNEWFDWYFNWLEREVDSTTGFWRKGIVYPADEWQGLFGSLAGGFHYYFTYEYFRLPMPYPESVIETCLLLFEKHDRLGREIGFAEIDWIYCLSRALRQTAHQRHKALETLWEMCDRLVRTLENPTVLDSEAYNDIHSVFGTLCAVAELQRALPGSIRTPKPLKLVLDRRPFI